MALYNILKPRTIRTKFELGGDDCTLRQTKVACFVLACWCLKIIWGCPDMMPLHNLFVNIHEHENMRTWWSFGCHVMLRNVHVHIKNDAACLRRVAERNRREGYRGDERKIFQTSRKEALYKKQRVLHLNYMNCNFSKKKISLGKSTPFQSIRFPKGQIQPVSLFDLVKT